MDKRLNWITIATPYKNTSLNNTLLLFLDDSCYQPEVKLLGEIKYRRVYEDLKPLYYAWATNPYDGTNRKLVGMYDTLDEAKIAIINVIENEIKELK
jgi:hypothetical protein